MNRRPRLNPGLTGSLQSAREVLARKANRMAHWDEQIGLPRGAAAAVPLLVLPMVVGSVLLLVLPASSYGAAAVIAATVAPKKGSVSAGRRGSDSSSWINKVRGARVVRARRLAAVK